MAGSWRLSGQEPKLAVISHLEAPSSFIDSSPDARVVGGQEQKTLQPTLGFHPGLKTRGGAKYRQIAGQLHRLAIQRSHLPHREFTGLYPRKFTLRDQKSGAVCGPQPGLGPPAGAVVRVIPGRIVKNGAK
jgi:hypothetical protein